MRTLIYMALIGLLGASCEKIIAEDITGEMPILILPVANDTVQNNPVHFKWVEMEGATKYHLMVVSPSFSAISEYSLDSIITGTDFYFDLDSNEYELKLVALNGGYESQTLGPIKFWVGVQGSIGGTAVVLNLPTAGFFENAAFDGKFSWNSVSNADSYEISVRQGSSFANGTILDIQNNISTLNFTSAATFGEGEYHWGVKAYLTTGGETPFSTRILYVDVNNPNVAVLTSPENFGSESSGDVVFTWSNGTDIGTIQAPVGSFVEVATDAGFSVIQNSQTVQGNTVTFSLSAGNYFWRVTNIDDAGNTAVSSATNQFTVF